MRIAANIGAALVTPVQNWASRSQAKMAEAQFNQVTMQNLQMQEQEIIRNREELELGFERLRSLPLPETNKQDILAEIDKFQENIQKKVKGNYANAAEYIRKEGKKDLAALANTIQNSDAYKLGLRNKAILAQYEEDRKKGLVPMMVNGKTFDQQLAEFQAGKVKELTYLDPYKPSVEFVKSIGSSYGKDRFTKQQATVDEIVMEMIKTNPGMTLAQAYDQLAQSGYDKIPLFYKFDDKYDKAKYDLDMYEKRDRIARRKEMADLKRKEVGIEEAKLNIFRQKLDIASQAGFEAGMGLTVLQTTAEREGGSKAKLKDGVTRVTTSTGQSPLFVREIARNLGTEIKDKETGETKFILPKTFAVRNEYGGQIGGLEKKDREINPIRLEALRDKQGNILKTYLVYTTDISESEYENKFGNSTYKNKYIGGEPVKRVKNNLVFGGFNSNDEVYRITARTEIPSGGVDASLLAKGVGLSLSDMQTLRVGQNNPNSELYND